MAELAATASWGSKFRLRAMIGTGMVMFVFISMHLTNLALGLFSVQLMEDWRWALSGVWSSFPPLKILLQASLVLHFLIALVSLYQRNTLKVLAYDMAQLIAGVLIVPLMGMHVFGVMAVDELGLEPTYPLVLGQFWVVSPINGLQQIALLVVAWIHGAIGVYTWLRSLDRSARVMNVFYPLVVALPILAMLGYVEAGRQIIPVDEGGQGFVLENDPNEGGPSVGPYDAPKIIQKANDRKRLATQGTLGLVGLVLLARWVRLYMRQRDTVRVTYAGRRPATFEAETGLTLLEMVREQNLPHANKCRGRGRCGTCRVRILSTGADIPPPGELEAAVLERWNAAPDERLACQLKPIEGELVVERVIEADYSNLEEAQAQKDGSIPAGAA